MSLPTGTVTFLLTDIEDSTGLWEQAPSAMSSALARHEDIVGTKVESHGGILMSDQGEGDSTLSVFSSASDAVTCALDVQRALSAEDWPTPSPIRLRMGLHSGEAEVRNARFLGPAVNKCARLRAIAAGGQIVMSSVTASIVASRLPQDAELIDLGERQLRSIPRPERVFQLLHADLPEGSTAAHAITPLVEPPKRKRSRVLVGREREMEQLNALLDEALAGVVKTLLIAGDPGVGKTRLSEELAEAAEARGVKVCWSHCYESGAPAYWPWIQVIRNYAARVDERRLATALGRDADVIGLVVPEVAHRPPQPIDGLDREAARFRLFDATASFLGRAARSEPLMLVFDDLHWADEPSLVMFEFIVRELRDAPVVIVATYRDREVGHDHPLPPLLGQLVREPNTLRLALGGLAAEHVKAFMREAFEVEPSPALVQQVHSLSEGNPLFMGEIVHLLASEDRLATSPEPGTISVPQTVREVIARRLHRLSTRCRAVLETASIIGREFGLVELAAVSEADEEELLDLLDEALSVNIIVETARVDRFSFSHGLMREALYERLRASARARLHRRVGEALETMYADDPEPHLAELAYQFSRSATLVGVDKAVDHASRAAELAFKQLAYEEAVRLYQMALDVLSSEAPVADERRFELTIGLADALNSSGDIATAKERFREAVELAARSGNGERLARAALGLGDLWIEVGVVSEELLSALESALLAMENQTDHPLRTRALARLAMELSFTPMSDRRETASKEAVASARGLGSAETLSYALIARRHAIWGPDSLDERLAVSEEATMLAAQASNVGMMLRARAMRLIDRMEIGEIDDLDEEIDRFDATAREFRVPIYEYVTTLLRAVRGLMRGEFAEAEQHVAGIFAFAERSKRLSALQAGWSLNIALRREQGNLGDVESVQRSLADRYDALPGFVSALALIYREMERPDDAREVFERLAVDDFASLPRDPSYVLAIACLAEVCAYLRDEARADILYRLLEPFAERNVVLGYTTPVTFHGSVRYFLGMLDRTLHRYDAAVSHLEGALLMNTKAGPPIAAKTQYQLARVLMMRDAPGDAEAARAHLTAASDAAVRLGMGPLITRTQRLTGSVSR